MVNKKNTLEKTLIQSKKVKDFRNKKYMMHKYWGKKPAKELKELILEYSNEQDLLLDPFAGYGGFSSEAVLANRNVISNDLNPISNFINSCLLSTKVDFELLDDYLKTISKETQQLREFWYKKKDGETDVEIVTALRTNDGIVKRLKGTENGSRKQVEWPISEKESTSFFKLENNFEITDWYPTEYLIQNSRISAKKGMKVSDLFDKRSLSCHAKLYQVIQSFPDGSEKDLLLLAFTSNLANCSKLVPPIKSRGEMAQGAWMTGFYTGETYLENNVFHYFSNRVSKIISGKKEYLEQYYDLFDKGNYSITNEDAKKISLIDESIDFIFTDFPYGDAVPYFEQSVMWNSWLKFEVDYKNEIVISDSAEREKKEKQFSQDIQGAVEEIYRVLKKDRFFVFTYHSLSGIEWAAITNSLLHAGFEVVDCELLVQKTFTPRQLNRKKTIKGDLLVVCRKSEINRPVTILGDRKSEEYLVKELFIKVISNEHYETNEIIVQFLKEFFKERVEIHDLNIISLIEDVADFDGKGWVLKDENL